MEKYNSTALTLHWYSCDSQIIKDVTCCSYFGLTHPLILTNLIGCCSSESHVQDNMVNQMLGEKYKHIN